MSNLILFGAGASYGSDTAGTPPLGTALFDALRRFDPEGWGGLDYSLASQFETDFEAGMVSVAESNPHALPILQRRMAIYFFQFKVKPTNLYAQLATRIREKGWNGALATLNYERFLEQSLLNLGLLSYGPTNSSQVEVCLPHGCCHLFCENVFGRSDAVSFAGQNVTTNGPVVAIRDAGEFFYQISTNAFPPVMSYFEPQKRTTSGASFIESQRNRWASLCDAADVIGVVGVQPRIHDSHIWGPLSATKATIVYCSGAAGATAFNAWRSDCHRTRPDTILPGYFSQEFDELCRLLAL